MENTQSPPDLFIHVCSRSPIAVWALERLLTSALSEWRFSIWLPKQMLVVSRGVNILVIDACSVPEWPEVVRQWNDVGHRTILVVEDNCDIGGVELRSLHFGVRGIVRVSDDFIEQMLEAIKCVAKGQVFATGETLDQFYCGFRRSRSGSPSSSLSFREEQTLELLTKGFSNKRIGHVLGISERTAKFHVCNILRKLQVGSRRELMNKYAETA